MNLLFDHATSRGRCIAVLTVVALVSCTHRQPPLELVFWSRDPVRRAIVRIDQPFPRVLPEVQLQIVIGESRRYEHKISARDAGPMIAWASWSNDSNNVLFFACDVNGAMPIEQVRLDDSLMMGTPHSVAYDLFPKLIEDLRKYCARNNIVVSGDRDIDFLRALCDSSLLRHLWQKSNDGRDSIFVAYQ